MTNGPEPTLLPADDPDVPATNWLDRWRRTSGWCLMAAGIAGLVLKFGALAAWCGNQTGCGPNQDYAGSAAATAAGVVSTIGISASGLIGLIGLCGLGTLFLRGRRWWLAVPVLIAVGFVAKNALNALEAWWITTSWITAFPKDSVVASESGVAVGSLVTIALGFVLLRPSPTRKALGAGLIVGAALWIGAALTVAFASPVAAGWHILLYQMGMWVLVASGVWIVINGLRARDVNPLLAVIGVVIGGLLLEAVLPSLLRGELGLLLVTGAAAVAGVRMVSSRGSAELSPST